MPRIRNVATGRFLEADHSHKVHTHAPHEGSVQNQLWHIEPRADGYFALVNNATDKALECHGGKIHAKDKHASEHAQEWKFEGHLIVNRKTGKVLDSNAKGEVYSSNLNNCDYQHWVQA